MENSLRWFLELGFKAVKVFLICGPDDGLEGLRKNEEMVALAREIVGDDVELAVDAWMGLDVEYTVRLVEALKPYRVLITAGGTREPIDPVRHIGNRSSGKMGYAVAEAARDRGAEVTLISAPTSLAAR